MIDQIKVILLDIEGTTTPIDFVHKTLFPYSRERIAKFVRENFEELNVEIGQLKKDHEAEESYTSTFNENSSESLANYLCFLIDNDRKSTPLKSIQGKIWQSGYESGEIRSKVFDDIPRAFKRWTAAGMRIAIYSSGSVQAQRDLFKHTDHGDLTAYICAYFDTKVGGKREVASYSKIVKELNTDPGEIIFISDVSTELDSARSAGMRTSLCIRHPTRAESASSDHPRINSFDDME